MKKVNTLTLLKEFYPYIKDTSFRLKLFILLKGGNERPHWFHNQIRLNSFFPPYPSPSFDRIVEIIKYQKRIPHTIDFAITSKCPYHCPHCSYGKRKKQDLDTNEILQVIKEIKELGTAILGISGGEPMARADLETIVAACAPELFTILYTTGFNFTKKRAKALYDAHIGSVFVGIDSVDPAVQDALRGTSGSLQLAKEALEFCHETGIYTGINTIATREKLQNDELERIYELASSLDVGELFLNAPIATGQLVGCTDTHLKTKELDMLKKIQKNLNKRRHGPIVTTLAEYETQEYMGCIAGYQTVFIDSSGEISPCDFTPLSFGNIKDTPLKDIWSDMEGVFPRPRAECLMREICHSIQTDVLPVPPAESKKMIPKLDSSSPCPELYKHTKKKSTSN